MPRQARSLAGIVAADGAGPESVAVLGDGSRLAAGTTTVVIRMWQLPNRKLLITMVGFSLARRVAHFNPTG